MDNITPEEVMQTDIDRIKSEQPKHDFVDILRKPPVIGNAYEMWINDLHIPCALCVMATDSMWAFVAAIGGGLIGGIREKYSLYPDDVQYLKIPEGYEVDPNWMFHGTMFKMFKEEIQPFSVQLRLLS